jgi:uncharacterized protein
VVKGLKRTFEDGRAPEAGVSRSFIAGSMAGAAFCLVGLASVSLMAPPLERAAGDGDQSAGAVVVADAELAPEAAPIEEKVAPAPENPPADTAPSDQASAPEVSDPPAAPAAIDPSEAVTAEVVPDESAAGSAPDVGGELSAGSEILQPDAGEVATSSPSEPGPDQPMIDALATPEVETSLNLAEISAGNPPSGEINAPDAPSAPNVNDLGAVVQPGTAVTPEINTPGALIAESGAAPAPNEAGQLLEQTLARSSGAGNQGGILPLIPEADRAAAADVAEALQEDAASGVPAEPAPAEDIAAPAEDIAAPADQAEAPQAPATQLPQVTPLPQPSEEPLADTQTADADADADVNVDAGAVEDGKPRVISLAPSTLAKRPEPGLSRTVSGVKINRLPSIGQDAAAEDDAAAGAEEVPEQDIVAADGAPQAAASRYAAAFTNAEGKPLMAVMVFDIGVEAGGLDVEALADLPFAVTIAVDPERPDASRAAAAYRAAGSEVAIFARNLPTGASASDFEVAFQIYQRALPEAVAYTGAVTADFQRNARMAQHLSTLLSMSGLGLVGYDQGLNPGRRAAERSNIPHASIDRLFDQADGGFEGLGREMDRASFTAAQKGSYLIALPSSPEAIAALLDWAGGPAASSVALAPVSAIMAVTQGAN